MESVAARFFLHNWPRKLVALLAALVIWLFVNNSINETKTISNIPIRIINLPADKTIQGLLPNGMLSRRITLTLTGSKDIIDELEPSDLEVLLDASTADSDQWIVQVSKKNLVSLNPSIDLSQHISQVSHSDFVIKLSKLVTAKVPVHIDNLKGSSPTGYEFLDIWPENLFQVVSGPEEEVQKLKETGLDLTFDLNEISKADLDAVKNDDYNNEISFPIPQKWKEVQIPFRSNVVEELNDPEAQLLHIDYLRHDFLPLDKEIPIRIFYPLDDLSTLNPESLKIAPSNDIIEKNGVYIFTRPLYVQNVSRLFLDVIRNSIEIVIVAAPKSKREILTWSVEFIDPDLLEDNYVNLYRNNNISNKHTQGMIPKRQDALLRERFREYMQRFTLSLANTKKLHLKSTLEGDVVRIVAY